MAIVRMKKLAAIGHESVKNDLMAELMRLGVVELNAQDEKLTDEEWSSLVSRDGNEVAVSRLDGEISKADLALETIERYGTAKKPLIRTRRAVAAAEFDEALKKKSQIVTSVDEVIALNNELNELRSAENRVQTNKLSLMPWSGYDVPLEMQGTRFAEVMIGVVPSVAEVDKLKAEVSEKSAESVVDLIGSDAEQHYLSILCMKKDTEEIMDLLKQYGFNRVTFKGVEGTASENIAKCDKELSEIAEKRAAVEEKIRNAESEKGNIEFFHDSLIIERDQEKVKARMLTTKRAFYVDGWVIAQKEELVKKAFEKYECYYEITEPEKGEETPVLLHNAAVLSPYEAITRLYALPDSRTVDATPFFGFFYMMFFGMMLADIAYGAMISIATFVILKSFRLEGMMKQMFQMFCWCGLATMFWGAMFGGFFGDLLTVIADTFFGVEFTITPLWINPLEEPMTLLIFCFILGAIHLALGMGLNAYLSIKDGRPFDAFCDVGLWYIFLAGLVLWLGGLIGGIFSAGITQIGLYMTVIGAVGIILTGGRHKKGIGKITGGLGSLYGVTSYLSDVLSYSRLLALGLASAVIASVVNTMGSLAGGGILGVFVMAIAFVIGHSYNIAINALGSFVHSCRLQYVEFFGKFYESGGEAFDPFNEKTKYVQILREDN